MSVNGDHKTLAGTTVPDLMEILAEDDRGLDRTLIKVQLLIIAGREDIGIAVGMEVETMLAGSFPDMTYLFIGKRNPVKCLSSIAFPDLAAVIADQLHSRII